MYLGLLPIGGAIAGAVALRNKVRRDRARARAGVLGLYPEDLLTANVPIIDPVLMSAVSSAIAGDSAPAAAVLNAVGDDWDSRAYVVGVFADVAARMGSGWLESWRRAAPSDPDAAVIYAESLVRTALGARGYRCATKLPGDRPADYMRILRNAESAARGAARLAPTDPMPWVTLVRIARGLEYPHEMFHKIWSELRSRAPEHYVGHQQALQYWSVRASGSNKLMVEFAEQAKLSAPVGSVLATLPLEAHLELWLNKQNGFGLWTSSAARTAIDHAMSTWSGARQPATGPSLESHAVLAFALAGAERGPEAVEQFQILGGWAGTYPFIIWGESPDKFVEMRARAIHYAAR